MYLHSKLIVLMYICLLLTCTYYTLLKVFCAES